MSLATITEITNSQIPFGQVVNPVSSSGTFRKQSVEQITDTEISYCNFSFSDFANIFRLEIADVIWAEFSDQIFFKLEYEDKFFVNLKLNGYWELEEEQKFQLIDVNWTFEEKVNNPTSVFVLNTFLAILCLSSRIKVEIPVVDYYFGVSVPSPLNNISEILQKRQLAYRLMVIEKAFKVKLPFPHFIDGRDVENIVYCYHSVIDRNFEWSCPHSIIPWLATPMYLSLLPENDVPFPMQYGPEPFGKDILGYRINLGLQTAKIEAYILDNFDDVKKKLSKLDGNEVLVQARSKSGVMQIESITTPTLPKNAFSKDIQKLIDLEEKFDSMYFDKYLNSFSNAFENLTDDQIQAVTERPPLEDNAFNF
jgi:hypothetical protein